MNKKLSLLICLAVLAVCLFGAVACNLHEHDYVEHAAVAATCDKAGNELYYTCSGCDKLFDKDKKEIASVPTIEAKGHVYNEHPAVSATCTTDGNELYYTCDVCKKIFDKDKNEIDLVPTITKGEHAYKEVAAKEPTCTEAGNELYYTCDGCNGLFDKDKKPIAEIPVIPAKNHAYHKVEEKAATCEAEGNQEYYTCDNGCGQLFDKDKKEITAIPSIPANGHKYVKHDAVAVTCEIDGNEAYFSCEKCTKLFDVDKKEIEKIVVIPATGHAFGWEKDEANHTAELKCIHDGCTNSKGTIKTSLAEADRLIVDYDSDGNLTYDLNKFGQGLFAVNVSFDNKTIVFENAQADTMTVGIQQLFAHSVKMGKVSVTISVKMDEGPTIYVDAPITLAKLINNVDDLIAIRPVVIEGRATVTGGVVTEQDGHKIVTRYYYLLTTDLNGKTRTEETSVFGEGITDEGYTSGDAKSGFVGVFDGNGHTIKNFTLNVRGFFGHVGGGTIDNVTFENIVLNNADSAVLGKLMDATVTNVTIKNVETAVKLSDTSGIVAYHEIFGSKINKLNIDLTDGKAAGHIFARQLTDGTGDWKANDFSDIVVKTNYDLKLSLTATQALTDNISGVSVKFNPFTVAKPAADQTTFYYTGHQLTYNVAENALYTVSGNKQTEIGSYTVTVTLKPYDGLTWEDGTTAELTFTFEIVEMTDSAAADLAQAFANKVTALNGQLLLPRDKMAVEGLVADYEVLHDKVKALLTDVKTVLDGMKAQADKYTQLEVVFIDRIRTALKDYEKYYIVFNNHTDAEISVFLGGNTTNGKWEQTNQTKIAANTLAQIDYPAEYAEAGNIYIYVNGDDINSGSGYVFFVYGYLDAQANAEALKAFTDALNAFETGALTIADESKVVAARTAYDALSAFVKKQVTEEQLTKLVNAENEILVAKNKAAAKTVADMIDALTNDSTAEEIQGARTAYNKLTDEQKKLVTNLDKLATAEQRIVDKIAAEFKAKVDALGTPSFPRDNDVVAALNAEFDGLIEAVKEKLGETKETLNKYIESASHYERLTPTFSNVKMSALNGCDSYMIVFTNETGSDIVFTYAADVPGWTDSGETYTLAKGTTLVVTIKKNFAEKGIYPYLDGQSKKMDAIEGLTVKVYGKKAAVGSEVVALSVGGTTDDPTYGKVLSGTIYDFGNTTQAWLQPHGFITLDNYNILKQYADKNLHFYLYNPCGEDVAVEFYMMDRNAWWPYYDKVTLKAGWNKISLSKIFADEAVNAAGVQPTIGATDVTALSQTGWLISDFYYYN